MASPKFNTAAKYQTPVTRWLLDTLADNEKPVTVEFVRDALFYRADVNAIHKDTSLPALTMAVYRNMPEIVQMLITHGADINGVDDGKSTALHAAIELGHITIARLLVDAGADKTLRDLLGTTPAELARNSGNDEMKALFAAKAFTKTPVAPRA